MKKPWTSTVSSPPSGQHVEVAIPKLAVAETTKVVTVEKGNSPLRTVGFIVGGVGVAGAVAATVTGIMLLDAKSTADERCTPRCIDQTGVDAVNRGETLLPINAVAWAVAAVGIGVGTLLVLKAPSSTTSANGSPRLHVAARGLRVAF